MPPLLEFNQKSWDQILNDFYPLKVMLEYCNYREIPVYLVGGAVRDLLFRHQLSADLDLVVPADEAKTVASYVSEKLDSKFICLDETYKIYRIILFPGLETLDIAGCIGPDIHADILRRDMTVNAMAYDFKNGILLDSLGGQKDLREGRIRMVNAANMIDDPLRMLRVFRIGAELAFNLIDHETLDVVRQYGKKLLESAPERVHYELMKLLSVKKCFKHVQMMAEIGLLEHIFPELTQMREVPPNIYHHLNLFDHTLELINQLENHFVDLPGESQNYLNTMFNPFTGRIAIVRLACLFHDLGKPATMQENPVLGRTTFYGHEEVSEKMVMEIAKRLKWGKEITRCVAHLVRWHLYPGSMLQTETSQKAQRKFFRRMGEFLPELILLAIADRYSAKGPAISQEELETKKAGLINLLDQYKTFLSVAEFTQKLVSGREVMNLLGIEPGPKIGEILRDLDEAQISGEISTTTEAMEWLKTRYNSRF